MRFQSPTSTIVTAPTAAVGAGNNFKPALLIHLIDMVAINTLPVLPVGV